MTEYIRKISLCRKWKGTIHRSGWAYALRSLRPLRTAGGVVLEASIDRKFGWGRDEGERHNRFFPYREMWIGFLHNPPGIPPWHKHAELNPLDILASEGWKSSESSCGGIFALSRYLADWLTRQVPVPVASVLHPTEEPALRFSPAVYRENRLLVQVGWWLRKSDSLFALKAPLHQKIILGRETLQQIPPTERALIAAENVSTVRLVPYIEDDEYDKLLARSAVFLDLYDSSANNTIVECMVRHTPVLVNRLPAVLEYLGPDYPLYFDTKEEAAEKLRNDQLVCAASDYLRELPLTRRLTGEAFCEAVHDSEIYQRL